eukprot:jgi/Hompol1/4543/HPOL_000099-RA
MPAELIAEFAIALAAQDPASLIPLEQTCRLLRTVLAGSGRVWTTGTNAVLDMLPIGCGSASMMSAQMLQLDGSMDSSNPKHLRSNFRAHLLSRCKRCGAEPADIVPLSGLRLCTMCLDAATITDHHARLLFPDVMAQPALVAQLSTIPMATRLLNKRAIDPIWHQRNMRIL